LGAVGEWIGMTETKVGSISRLILETLGVLNRGLKARELTHEVPFPTDGLFRTDEDQLFDNDRTVRKYPRSFPVVEVAWVDVNVVKFGKRGFGGIQVVGSQRCPNINPRAIADIRA
jgi:hypothetical protein